MLPVLILGVFVGWTVHQVRQKRKRQRQCEEWNRQHSTPLPRAEMAPHAPPQKELRDGDR